MEIQNTLGFIGINLDYLTLNRKQGQILLFFYD